jgi:nucleotide-binding universal stress UspA family protein
MATHGRSGIGRWVLGSVADKVLRGASTPVLLVRADQTDVVVTGHPRRILVPLDGSDLAEQALPLAQELARRAGAALHLIRSVTWPWEGSAAIAALDATRGADLIEREEAAARAYLAAVSAGVARQGVAVTTSLCFGSAGEAILANAAAGQADLIVMSTHGRGGLGRWALGSVADRVLHGASVPVLLVRSGLPAGDADGLPRTTSQHDAMDRTALVAR